MIVSGVDCSEESPPSVEVESLYYAHIRRDEKGILFFHNLEEHITKTAQLAARFAENFGSSDWARQAGMWHDLGKYQPEFQHYIKEANDVDAHIEGSARKRVDHSTVGALYAVEQLGVYGQLIAYLIAGHHAGLTDFDVAEVGNQALKPRLHRAKKNDILSFIKDVELSESLLAPNKPASQPPGDTVEDRVGGLHLWLRMLYSCLTDADFLDTESFMQPDRPNARAGFPTLQQLHKHFSHYMAGLTESVSQTTVNQMRYQVLQAAIQKSILQKGVFSLTVPTGGGKTLSSMAFALNHALHHKMDRVIYVIPYTGIIEQTVDVFRRAFGKYQGAVVEHHSSAESDPAKENHNSRLACENWDAPIIVTTTVQFFESLFAARSSRCRKLHNIVNSVVILDEAQLIPPEFREIILDTLNRLAKDYGITLVVCTATQPELGSVNTFELSYQGLPEPIELALDPEKLYQSLKRVEVELPEEMNQSQPWEEIAEELLEYPSFLCIVNKRDDCRQLYELMPEGTYHLSALMCGQHRADTIKAIKKDLAANRPTRVVSTQLVEAGVDLDFPVVYRAIAGLDSIAQAAGRCNREGELKVGLVKVFIPPSENFGLIARAESATREILYGFDGDLLYPSLYRDYFQLFYSRIPPDKKKLKKLLTADRVSIQFRSAADRFKLIDDSYQQTVFVDYDESGEKLLEQLRSKGPERWLMRKLQRYAVSVKKEDVNHLLRDGFIEEILPDVLIQHERELYDRKVGLITHPERSAEGLVL
jgi:CRISPR-associated endonuclease/helicase Cas3